MKEQTMKNIQATLMAIAAVIVLAAFVSCDARAQTIDPPGAFTLPGKWLKNVPLDQVNDQELVTVMGAPANTMVVGEQVYWVYEYDEPKSTWTFVMNDGIVVDVVYRSEGGRTESARERQK
jgi:hypothetical protein